MHERFLQYLAQQSVTPSVSTSQSQEQPAEQAQTAQKDPFGSYLPLMMIVVFFAVIYFTVMRPQKKEEKRKKDMLETLQKGDTVITSSGMIGTVASIKDDIIMLKIGDGVRVEFLRSAISAVRKSATAGKPEVAAK